MQCRYQVEYFLYRMSILLGWHLTCQQTQSWLRELGNAYIVDVNLQEISQVDVIHQRQVAVEVVNLS